MSGKMRDPHYPNPWVGPLTIAGLAVLVFGLLAFAVLKPDEPEHRSAEGAASAARMDAAQQRADQAREAERSRAPFP